MTANGGSSPACWSCGAQAPSERVAVETVIRGRPPADGGPYRVFRCVACGVENGVLAGPRGGLLLHPLTGLESPSVLDRLLSARERERLLGARDWWARNRDRVQRFRAGADPGASPSAAASPRPRPRPVASGPHAVLGVPADATPREIRRAFLRLAKRWHPDRAGPGAASKFRAVRAAYDELRRAPR